MYAVLYVYYRHRECIQADETAVHNCECYIILNIQPKIHRARSGRSAVVPYSFNNHQRFLISPPFRALNTFHLIWAIYLCNWYIQPYTLYLPALVLDFFTGIWSSSSVTRRRSLPPHHGEPA